ncbi:MAG TPA: methyltransferase domain-containing protein [Nitrososphaeraceae archaeon]|jgi:ubiquinone/menaquinone biosynthesis C-methylase UbiE|nr:methyltransferase domain-containing protein [Nitrososphaeraceae archaeon]
MNQKLNDNINESKIQEFMNKAIQDIAGSSTAMLVILGERLGLYKAMTEENKYITFQELAKKTGTNERLVKEWLGNQVTSGYIEYDPSTMKYFLPPEHALALSDSNSPIYIQGAFKAIKSYFKDEEEFIKMFKNERTFSWLDHHPCMADGFAEFFKAGYIGNLLNIWIPSLENGKIQEKLKQGGIKVADVGCGYGISTILMAKAFPNSEFIGFDFHKESIEKANNLAKQEDLNNVKFEVFSASEFPGTNYNLITLFDCLHDMGDPQGALAHILDAINKDEGVCMIVEPYAQNKLEDNINPISKTFYAASTLICVPNSLAFNGPALGAQAGEERIRDIVTKSGFSQFKRAIDTPINIVYEIKP